MSRAGYSRYLQPLARFARLIVFDKRGVGMSDRIAGVATLEERMDDLRAVMDAVGSRRAVMFGQSEGRPMAVLFAATFPERTTALVVYGSMVRGGWRPDDPDSLAIAPTRADYDRAPGPTARQGSHRSQGQFPTVGSSGARRGPSGCRTPWQPRGGPSPSLCDKVRVSTLAVPSPGRAARGLPYGGSAPRK